MKTKYLTILTMLLFSITVSAEPRYFMGAQVGHADMSDNFDGFRLDDSRPAVRLYAGWRVSEHIALEAGYQALGDFEQNVGMDRIKINAEGFTFSAAGLVPLSQRLEASLHLGAFFWDGYSKVNDVTRATPSDRNLLLGVGLRYKVTDSFSITTEWRQYDLSSSKARTIGAGLELLF